MLLLVTDMRYVCIFLFHLRYLGLHKHTLFFGSFLANGKDLPQRVIDPYINMMFFYRTIRPNNNKWASNAAKSWNDIHHYPWWRHNMEIFSALLALLVIWDVIALIYDVTVMISEKIGTRFSQSRDNQLQQLLYNKDSGYRTPRFCSSLPRYNFKWLPFLSRFQCFQSSPSGVYLRQYTRPTFVHIMAWLRTIETPLSEQMLTFSQSYPYE